MERIIKIALYLNTVIILGFITIALMIFNIEGFKDLFVSYPAVMLFISIHILLFVKFVVFDTDSEEG